MKQKEAPTEHNETGCWAMLLKDSSYRALAGRSVLLFY